MNTCMKCAHKNVCVWCIDDSDYDFPTCSDFLEERPTGEWIIKSNGITNYNACNKCGSAGDFQDHFCRVCGADMRGNDT